MGNSNDNVGKVAKKKEGIIQYFGEVAKKNHIDINSHIHKNGNLDLKTLWEEMKDKNAIPYELIKELDPFLQTI